MKIARNCADVCSRELAVGCEGPVVMFMSHIFTKDATTDVGHVTLENLGAVPAVGEWTIAQFAPYLGSAVFEAGAGSGNLTRFLCERPRLVCVDIDPVHVDRLKETYRDCPSVTVMAGDLEDSSLYERWASSFDSVVSVNVVEHLEDPQLALRGFFDVLAPGGHAIILVPAHQWLFSAADRALGHWRRYERTSLAELCRDAGFEVESIRQFNRLGVVGWLMNKAFRRTRISRWQARAFGILLPFAKLLEKVEFLPGLSLIAVARKP